MKIKLFKVKFTPDIDSHKAGGFGEWYAFESHRLSGKSPIYVDITYGTADAKEKHVVLEESLVDESLISKIIEDVKPYPGSFGLKGKELIDRVKAWFDLAPRYDDDGDEVQKVL